MQKEDKQNDAARNERILDLFPEFERRYQSIKKLLEQAACGQDINDARLWLAQGDLLSVTEIMIEGKTSHETSDLFETETHGV